MKNTNNRNSLKTPAHRFGAFVLSASVLLTAFAVLTGPALAQHADKAVTPNCASPENKASENDAGDTDLSRDETGRIADNHADAVKNRDNKTQYALISKALKAWFSMSSTRYFPCKVRGFHRRLA